MGYRAPLPTGFRFIYFPILLRIRIMLICPDIHRLALIIRIIEPKNKKYTNIKIRLINIVYT